MKIKKELKNATFEYDEETQKFLISGSSEEDSIELNKIYAFAFMRFVVRISQKNWLKSKKVIDKDANNVLSSKNNEEENNKNQTTIPWDEGYAIDCTSSDPF